MALADTAKLVVDLSLKGNFASQLGKSTKALGSFDAKLDQTESRAFRAGQQIGTGINNGMRLAAVGVGLLVSQIALGLRSLVELEQMTTQTNAVIKSTGSVAGVSAEMVRRLAEEYESLNATISDETIQNAENLLLTFTNIRKDAFEPTLKAILDMNTALGGGPEGLTGIAQLVGRALDNPEKGLQLLERRIGKFTDAQRAQIKEAIEQNRLFDAQTIILDKLNTKYGGSFLAQGGATAGKVAKFTDSIEDLQRALATALLPTLGNVADALSKTLADPAVIAGVTKFGQQLAKLVSPENLATAGAILKEVFNTAKAAAPSIAAAAQIMAKVVGTAVSVFKSLPPEIQQLAIGAFAINKLTGGLVTNLAGGLISAVLKQLVSGVVNVAGGVVNVTGPGMIGDVGKGVPPVVAGGGAAAAGGGALAGLGAGLAGIAAGVAVSALAIMGLGELSNALSTPEQKAAAQQRVIDENLRKRRPPSMTPESDKQTVGILNRIDKETRDVAAQNRRLASLALTEHRIGERTTSAVRDTTSAVRGTTSAVDSLPGRLRNALGGLLYQGGGRAAKDDPITSGPRSSTPRRVAPNSSGSPDDRNINVKVTTSTRDQTTAATVRRRWGPTPAQAGAA